MFFRRFQRFKAVACVLAMAVYALPAGRAVLTTLSHAASHLVVTAKEQHRIATSLGLSHQSSGSSRVPSSQPGSMTAGRATEATTARLDGSITPDGVAIVHTHDGSTHAHTGLVGDLVSATITAESMTPPGAVVAVVGAHVPATAGHGGNGELLPTQALVRVAALFDLSALSADPRPPRG